MEFQFLGASFVNLVINILYTLVALFVKIKALLVMDEKLLKSIDLQKEFKEDNVAVTIFESAILLFGL